MHFRDSVNCRLPNFLLAISYGTLLLLFLNYTIKYIQRCVKFLLLTFDPKTPETVEAMITENEHFNEMGGKCIGSPICASLLCCPIAAPAAASAAAAALLLPLLPLHFH